MVAMHHALSNVLNKRSAINGVTRFIPEKVSYSGEQSFQVKSATFSPALPYQLSDPTAVRKLVR
jgi:hypothetical protein